MTPQPVGANGWSGRRSPNDRRFLSHSSLGKVLASEILENWAISKTAEVTIENLGTLAHMAKDDPEEAKRFIRECRFQKRPGTNLTEAQRGTFLHSVFENWLCGVAAPPVPAGEEWLLQPMIDQLTTWMQLHRPEAVAVELVVYNLAAETAGRGDAWLRFGAGPIREKFGADTVWHCDLKTAADPRTGRGNDKRPYADSVGLQLAGGRWAEKHAPFEPRIKNERGIGRQYLLNDAEEATLLDLAELVGAPEEMRTAVIHLTPEWGRTFPIETGEKVLERLKDVRGGWAWQKLEANDTLHPYIEGAA
jgi:hypothetical protein